MKDAPETQEVSMATYRNAARRFYFTAPLYLLVPTGFWLVFQWTGIRMNWAAFGIGAVGWFLALMFRGPIAVLVRNLQRERAATVVGSVSGPLEEGFRLLALALQLKREPVAQGPGLGRVALPDRVLCGAVGRGAGTFFFQPPAVSLP